MACPVARNFRLRGDVDRDRVHGLAGDLFGAVDDGLDCGTADQPEQAPDHPASPLMEVGGELGEAPWLVPVQPEAAFERGDQGGPLAVAGEGPGADHGEPAGDLLASGSGEQACPLDADPREHEGGGDALGEVLQGVGRLGAGAGGDVEVVDLVHADDAGPGVGADTADRLDDVGDVGPLGHRDAEEPGELGGDHLGGGSGRDGDVDNRDAVGGPGVAAAVDDLDGLAELGDRGGLPGPGGAGDDQAGPPVMGGPVEVGEPPPGGGDAADARGMPDQVAGVVGDPVVVVSGPLFLAQTLPDPAVQQFRD